MLLDLWPARRDHRQMEANSNRPVAVVTGAGRGIGRAVAHALASRNFNIAVVDIAAPSDAEAMSTMASLAEPGLKAGYFQADIADVSAHAQLTQRLIADFGRIDCLVNNAGVQAQSRSRDFFDATPEEYDAVMSVNLRGTLFLTQQISR